MYPLIRTGPDNSYFGFSLAFHTKYYKETNKTENLIIVGAPKAEDSRGSFSKPGIIFSCSLNEEKCEALNLEADQIIDKDDKNDQWLGISISNQRTIDGKILACAHRYKENHIGSIDGYGICYIIDNNLINIDTLEPCSGREPRENYTLSQAGTSSFIYEDGTIVIGTPGSFLGQGGFFKNSLSSTDNNWIGVNRNQPIFSLNTYLGWSVKIGKILKGEKTYIASTPKFNDKGEIAFFKELNGFLQTENKYRLTIEQVFSGFGTDLVIGDFNNDGLEDLVVGAPFYWDQKVNGAIFVYTNDKKGITALTKPLKIVHRSMKEQECLKLNCFDSRFGFSLALLGDIDKDGFQDIAVGAPFEGNGVVYIFRGSSKSIIPMYSQRIEASQIDSQLKSFGYSLASNFDSDDNTYPDLIIGSYESAKVSLLRTRPVINISLKMSSEPKAINPIIDFCPFDSVSTSNCFKIEACVKFTAEPKNKFTEKMDLNYTIIFEKISAKLDRSYFKSGSVEITSVFGVITMNKQSKNDYNCVSHIAFLKKDIKNILNPIVLWMSYDLKDSKVSSPSKFPSFFTFPILNLQSQNKNNLNIEFLKNCGTDNICTSDLKLTADTKLKKNEAGLYVMSLVEDLKINIEVRNEKEDAHEATLYIDLPPNVVFVGIEYPTEQISCYPTDNSNYMEEIKLLIVCEIGNPFASMQKTNFTVKLNPRKIMAKQEFIKVNLFLNTTSSEIFPVDNVQELYFQVLVEADIAVFGLSVPGSIFYIAEKKEELDAAYKKKIEFFHEMGPTLRYIFEVKNVGKVIFPSTNIIIHWPWKFKKGNYLFYIVDEPQIGNGYCSPSSYLINPLKLKEGDNDGVDNEAYINQTKESLPYNNIEQIDFSSKIKRFKRSISNPSVASYDLRCNEGSSALECEKIECHIEALSPGSSVVITIHSRFSNHELQKNIPDYNNFATFVKAEVVQIEGQAIKQINIFNDITEAKTLLFKDERVEVTVSWWIYLIAAIIGLLLLIFLIALLWKLGFFKRKTRPQQWHKATVVKEDEKDEVPQ